MAVSVRMDPLLEKQLELAAQRKGVTKSQFIIDAVERALGHKNPYDLMLQVQAEAQHVAREPAPPPLLAADTSLSEQLRGKLADRHDAARSDWEAFQAARRRGERWPPADDQEAAS